MVSLVRDKKLEGISDIRDESGKEGIRLVIELKRNAVPNVLLNNLTREFEPLCVSSAQEVEEALLGDRFALIAAQDLEVGEELTHDYNDIDDPPYYDSLCEQYGVSWEWLKS